MDSGGGSRGAREQALDGDHALVTEVDAELVHVERDVRVADLVRHLLRVRADVAAARLRVREGVLDRGSDRHLGGGDGRVVEVGAGEDARPAAPAARVLLPPRAEVGDRDEAVVRVGEAALVDDQPGVDLAPRTAPRIRS